MKVLGALGLAGLASLAALLACSRPSTGETSAEQASSRSSALALPLSAEAPAPSAGPILTPEDAEPEVEHRITEQNLESELDRLEREIQAE